MTKQLNPDQRYELIEQYVELVDNVTQQYPKQLNQFGG